jgi:hypothetical protein
LLSLDGFEQGFEVSGTEPGEVIALDDLNKDRRSIHEVLYVSVSTRSLGLFG